MKERIDTLLALSASLAGQAKDLRDRASAIVTEEEKLRREIAAERALPLKVGYAIARRHRRGTKGVPRPKFERETKPDYTGDACPKCQSRRVWISGETLRCRDCGTRFVPDDLPPAEEEADS